MPGGYAGRLLRVDLTTGQITNETLPSESVLRQYIGAVGLASRILYDEVPVKAGPLDPENRLIFMTGPLTGTPAPCSSECAVMCLHGETGNTMGQGHMHGFFGATLKFAGYDGIVVQGAAEKPVYVWVQDGKAEIRDAGHLWGKDTHETYKLLKEELRQPEAAVACIGPGGENLVMGASVCCDYNHMSSKGGGGRVMGSKKLKAIAVHGTGGVNVADPDGFLTNMLEWRKDMLKPPATALMLTNGGIARFGYEVMGMINMVSFKNLRDPEGGQKMGKALTQMVAKSKLRPQGSFGCPIACAYNLKIGEGPHAGFMATPGGGGENIEGASMGMGVTDPGTCMWLVDQFDRMGLDSAAPGAGMALLFELYERGAITKADVDGLELNWGNAEAIVQLLHKMVKREGIGKVLAEGPKATAEHFGGDALKYSVHIKGAGPNLHDWRATWDTVFSYGVSTAGPCHQGIRRSEPDLGPEFNDPFPLLEPLRDPEKLTYQTRIRMFKKFWEDSIGLCWFATMSVPNALQDSIKGMMLATGWSNITQEEIMEIGNRITNLQRAFSVQRGATAANDLDYGGRWLDAPPAGIGKGFTVAPHLKSMTKQFYSLMGWDENTGKPKEETLTRLGLAAEARDLAGVDVSVKVDDVSLVKEAGPEKT